MLRKKESLIAGFRLAASDGLRKLLFGILATLAALEALVGYIVTGIPCIMHC